MRAAATLFLAAIATSMVMAESQTDPHSQWREATERMVELLDDVPSGEFRLDVVIQLESGEVARRPFRYHCIFSSIGWLVNQEYGEETGTPRNQTSNVRGKHLFVHHDSKQIMAATKPTMGSAFTNISPFTALLNGGSWRQAPTPGIDNRTMREEILTSLFTCVDVTIEEVDDRPWSRYTLEFTGYGNRTQQFMVWIDDELSPLPVMMRIFNKSADQETGEIKEEWTETSRVVRWHEHAFPDGRIVALPSAISVGSDHSEIPPAQLEYTWLQVNHEVDERALRLPQAMEGYVAYDWDKMDALQNERREAKEEGCMNPDVLRELIRIDDNYQGPPLP